MNQPTHKFKAEVQQLLDLVIHSLYSNKDIFIRELVANAADAIDKAKFEALTKPDINAEWEIKIQADKTRKILSISDNGVGMTEDEVVENIGTIAKSGTKAFMEALSKKDAKDTPELIGQFGVGFYSAFMVSEKIEIVTKRAGSDAPAVRWESEGRETYTLEPSTRTEQGTTINIHLREECSEYLEDWKIREIVKKYSDFIEFPVKILVKKKNPDESESSDWETINSQKAIWLRPESEITDDEYKQFFAHLAHSDSDPLCRIHYSAEGVTEFRALLFLPSKTPFDAFFPEARKKGLHLYVRRVFITDSCPSLLPEYLRFARGVVDSSDLPLNVSRELLQENPLIHKINKNLTLKILNELKKILENSREKYESFFKELGRCIKEGICSDHLNKEKLQDLLMYESMNNPAGKLLTLKEYCAAMPSAQKEIYYVTGEDRNTLENSPFLEMFRKKGFDVLFLTDPVDEWVVQNLFEYDKKKLKSVAKGGIEFDEETKKELDDKKEKADKEHKTLVEFLKKELADKVKDVRFSPRLTESACCLVGDQHDPSPNLEKIFKALNQEMPKTKRILELNPDHPLVGALHKLYDKDPKSPKLCEYVEMLYDQALLSEGSPIGDHLKFAKRVANLMAVGMEKEL